ncbi:MAG: putative inorganic carbon transporter subunit DabA, partial [Ramlibacter sp.]
DLAGRSFLHDYHWQRDSKFGVLEGIMTAPMVVTNWISMQYFASTVDNKRYGSGDKVLHNVVGGNVGVFEGNGGDLRIGLPMQSLHDGQRFRHTPLRLSVFIQAPQAPIDAIVASNPTVRHLVDNEWLHLFRLGDDAGIWRYRPDGAWIADTS